MASLHTYTVLTDPISGEVSGVQRDDFVIVKWADADFQVWNSAQPTPATLSTDQQQIQQARAMDFATFSAKPQAYKDRVLFILMKRALNNETV